MARRKLLGLLGFGTGILAGSVVYRRSFGRRRARVDIYFDDGSMITYDASAPEAAPLLTVAEDALAATRR
jgi:hypothetical protein